MLNDILLPEHVQLLGNGWSVDDILTYKGSAYSADDKLAIRAVFETLGGLLTSGQRADILFLGAGMFDDDQLMPERLSILDC